MEIICEKVVFDSHSLHLNNGNTKEKLFEMKEFKFIEGEDYYLEMMFHGINAEAKILPDIHKLGKEMDVKLITSNDTHYTKKSDAKFHEVVICMSTGRTLKDPKRLKFPYAEFYFKSKEEMY